VPISLSEFVRPFFSSHIEQKPGVGSERSAVACTSGSDIVTLTNAERAARSSPAPLLSVLVAALGASVLAGWALNVTLLKSIVPGGVTMKPNTALAMLATGIALALLSTRDVSKGARLFATVMGCGVMALGALTLGEAFFGRDLGIDQWLFREATGAVETASLGRMSPPAAFSFVLMGIALVWASRPFAVKLRIPVLSALSVTVILVGGLGLLGHLSLALFNVRFWNYSGLAMHTAAGLLLLGCALLALVRSGGGVAWSIDAMTSGVFVVGIASIVAAAGISYSSTDELRQDARGVARSQEVLKEIQELMVSQKDLTISLGRYLITRDEASLAERARIKVAVLAEADDVRPMIAENPRQQSRLDEVARLTGKRIALSDQIIAKTQQQALPAGTQPDAPSATGGSDSPLGQEYPALGQETDRVLREMEAEEYALLQQHLAQSEASSTRTFLLMPVGVYLSLTVLLLGLFLLNSGTLARRRSESELSVSVLRFQQMADSIRDVFFLGEADSNRMLYVNPAYEEIWGRSREGLYANPESWADSIHPDDRASTGEKYTEGMSTGKFEYEYRIVRPDGSIRWIQLRGFPVRDDAGRIARIAGVAEDITERKQIDITRARMAAIVDSSEDAIIGKDINGIVTDWNAGATKVFGFSAEEMVGNSIVALLPADRLHEEDQILERIGRGETVEHLETVRKRKDGQLIDVSITVSPIKDAAGKVTGASKIARDITERNNLEQQLRQSQKMEAVGQLTGGIAHDFNNLLGVVLGNLDLLERLVVGNEPAIQRVKNAQKAAMRGADLSRRMLAFSSRQPLNPAPTSLGESIQNMIEMAARALGPDIKITTNLDPSVPPVLVDSMSLENALLNLAVNARDAMPQGGSLMISTRLSNLEESYPPVQAEELKPGRYARIAVSDTGHGMSPETLERAFEPFFTTKPRGKGTGLGLAMVYGFARRSGGTVRIYSEPGRGTTVSLYLPLAAGMPVPAPVAAASSPQARAVGTVLVVDDEVDLLEIAVAYLEDMGYRALHATDGAHALEVLAREPGIDLLITDVMMPGGMNGVELARKVRELKPDVKIIYSSGFPSEALAERSGTQVDGPLLYKPYQRNEFATAIRRVMDGDNTILHGDPAAQT
jgi:PAS domain S-box-containing protein